jgi:hypothetical protein
LTTQTSFNSATAIGRCAERRAMFVDVVFDQIRSAQVCVEVPDDATEEQIEEAARKLLEESVWSTPETFVIKIVCEPSL